MGLAADDPVVVECDETEKLKFSLVRSGMSASIEKDGKQLVIVLKSGYEARDVNEHAHQQGIVLTHLETRKKSLESQFLELVKQ